MRQAEGKRPATTGTRGDASIDIRALLRRSFVHAVAPTRLNITLWAVALSALALELVLVGVLAGGHIYEWEQDLTRLLQKFPGRENIFDVANFLTNTISPPFALIFAAVVLAAVVLRHYAVAMLVLLTFPVHVLTQFPKVLIDRPRPSAMFEGIEGVGGFRSFPSGHAEFVITFYGFITYLLVLHIKNRWVRLVVIAAFLSLVAATGFARISTGRHWPIDIFASYVFGIGALAGLIWLHRALRRARTDVLGTSQAARKGVE